MRIHYLQHVPFEDPANILDWAHKRGHTLSRTLLYDNEPLPGTDSFDWLIIMGGPMNIYEEEKYSWLVEEKYFIGKAISEEKAVLGICLGAQLIADVLGAKVYGNIHKEIGWFPATLTEEARRSEIFGQLPETFTPLHWHGDTFDIPAGCMRTAGSEACANQAFEYGGRVVGLQFHLESSKESIKRLIENCGGEIVEGRYIQSAQEMLAQEDNLHKAGIAMNIILDAIERNLAA